MVVGARDSRDP